MKRLFFLFLFLISSFGILESYFRFFSPISNYANHTTSAFGLPTAFRKNLNVDNKFKNFPFKIKTDSKKLRNFHEVSYKKEKNTYRILCIGGSIFAAAGVNNNETFAYYLEEKLKANRSNIKFEVINAGKNTWELADFYTFYINEGHKYQPDLIIIYFHTGELKVMDYSELEANILNSKRLSPNHVEIEIRGLNFNQRLNGKAAMALNILQSISFYDFLFNHSHLIRFLEKLIRNCLVFPKSSVKKQGKSNLESFMQNWDLKQGDHINWITDYGEILNSPLFQSKTVLYSIALEHFLKLVEGTKSKVLFLSIPSPKEILESEVNFKEAKPFRIKNNPNLYWLELLSYMKEIQDSSMIPLNFPNKIHWTPAGHNAAAALVYNFIYLKNFIPSAKNFSVINLTGKSFTENLIFANKRISKLLKKQGHDLYIKGMVYKKLNHLESAEFFLKSYLKVSPQPQNALWQLANLYFLKKRFKKSIEFTDLAIKRGYRRNDAVYAMKGKSHFNLRNFKKAETFFKKAIAYSPNYFRNRLNYARLLFHKKNYDKSLSQLIVANALFPNQLETLKGIASIYLKIGKNKNAQEILNAILKIDPKNKLALQLIKKFDEI